MNDVTSDATQVTGQAEPGSTVTVTFPDGTTATGTADDQGNYTMIFHPMLTKRWRRAASNGN